MHYLSSCNCFSSRFFGLGISCLEVEITRVIPDNVKNFKIPKKLIRNY